MQAYVLNLGLLHWLAAALYLLPWYTNHDPDVVALGLQQGTFAVLGFGVGSLLLAPLFGRATANVAARPVRGMLEPRLARRYVQVGLFAFFGLSPIVGRIPTVSAVVVQGWNLLVVGLGLMCWLAWRARREQAFVRWFIVALCLPLVTVVTQGFIGYGMAAATRDPRVHRQLLSAPVETARHGAHSQLRGIVAVRHVHARSHGDSRGGVERPTACRADSRVQLTLSTFEWFDLHNQDHLVRIDDRLNQNLLVGAAVQYMDAGLAPFAYGQTLYQGVIAVIPRAIWPTKPVVAGSGSLVTQYTGIQFAEGTAVGIGHVMEAYISFGVIGVIGGFIALGTLIGAIDGAAGRRLRAGDLRGFVQWFLPGLSFLQVGGSIVELTSSVAAAVLAAWLVNRLLRPGGQAEQPSRQPVLVARGT